MSEPLFEDMYAQAGDDLERIPWARLAPRAEFVEWLDATGLPPGRALVVACGLGDDAEELARRGFDVDAFDSAPTAIAQCRKRFPGSQVRYRVADLFALPGSWSRHFELVVEIYTLQSLPADVRRAAMSAIADTVAPGGRLLVGCLGREDDQPVSERPWPLSRAELAAFAEEGLTEVGFRDVPAGPNTHRRFYLDLLR